MSNIIFLLNSIETFSSNLQESLTAAELERDFEKINAIYNAQMLYIEQTTQMVKHVIHLEKILGDKK